MKPSLATLALALPLALGACTQSLDDGGATLVSAADSLTQGCAESTQVLVYAPHGGWRALAEALAARPNRCAHYYLPIPGYTKHDGGADGFATSVKNIHDLGPNFHVFVEVSVYPMRRELPCLASAEDFERAGRDFRALMAKWTDPKDPKRLRVEHGEESDTWYVNEFGSTLTEGGGAYCMPRGGKLERCDPEADGPTCTERPVSARDYQDKMRALLRGLGAADPQGRWPAKKGAVYRAAFDDKEGIKGLLTYPAFWNDVGENVRWWGEERYASVSRYCPPPGADVDVGAQAASLNAWAYRMLDLAQAKDAPASASRAAHVLARTYAPLLSAVQLQKNGYGDSMIHDYRTLNRFWSLEVYSVRARENHMKRANHAFGFAWADPTEVDAPTRTAIDRVCADPDVTAICGAPLANDEQRLEATRALRDRVFAPRLARAIDAAFGPSNKQEVAARACLTEGTLTGCACRHEGGALVEPADWSTW